MSIKLMSLVFERSFEDFARENDPCPAASSCKLVALSLLDHASDEGYSVRPSIAKTAAKTDLKRRAVAGVISAFRRSGMLIETGRVGRTKRVVEYRFSVERLFALPRAIVVPAPNSASNAILHDVHDQSCIEDTINGAFSAQGIITPNHPVESKGARKRATPEDLPRKKTKTREELTPEQKLAEQELASAIRTVTRIVAGHALVNKTASDLRKAGYDARDVLGLYSGPRSAWTRFDFRGKKGERPTVGLIPQTIGSLSERASSSQTNDGAPVSRQAEILRMAREKTQAIRERGTA